MHFLIFSIITYTKKILKIFRTNPQDILKLFTNQILSDLKNSKEDIFFSPLSDKDLEWLKAINKSKFAFEFKYLKKTTPPPWRSFQLSKRIPLVNNWWVKHLYIWGNNKSIWILRCLFGVTLSRTLNINTSR
jgi:hypothetical protein